MTEGGKQEFDDASEKNDRPAIIAGQAIKIIQGLENGFNQEGEFVSEPPVINQPDKIVPRIFQHLQFLGPYIHQVAGVSGRLDGLQL